MVLQLIIQSYSERRAEKLNKILSEARGEQQPATAEEAPAPQEVQPQPESDPTAQKSTEPTEKANKVGGKDADEIYQADQEEEDYSLSTDDDSTQVSVKTVPAQQGPNSAALP